MIKKIFDHLFAIPCPSCKKENALSSSEFCQTCLEKLNLISPPFCPGCGGELDGILIVCSKCLLEEAFPWESAIAIMQLKGLGSKLIQRYKYNNDTSLSRPFAAMAFNGIKKSQINFDLISFIPLHWRKRFARGYNQTEIIAKHLSALTNVNFKQTLTRNRHTSSQTTLTGQRRRKNLLNAFSLKNPTFIHNRNILLIDDVFTTGSTLRAAAEEILKANPKSISILVLARK